MRDRDANVCDRNGQLREVLVSLSPVALGNEPHLLLLAQDLSERARLERQLRQKSAGLRTHSLVGLGSALIWAGASRTRRIAGAAAAWGRDAAPAVASSAA